MKKISVFILIFVLFATTKTVSANDTLEIHLFYNAQTDTLSFDKSFSPTINLNKNKDTYIPEFEEKYSAPGPYELMLIGVDEIFLGTFPFTPPIGTFTIDVPDFNITKTIEIRKSVNSTFLLTQDISRYISCNRNGVCEYEKGETMSKCVVDCSNGFIEYSPQTIALFNANDGKIIDPQTGLILIKDARERQRGNSQTGPLPSQDDPNLYVTMTTSTATTTEDLSYDPYGEIWLQENDAPESLEPPEVTKETSTQPSSFLIIASVTGFLATLIVFLFFLYRRKNI